MAMAAFRGSFSRTALTAALLATAPDAQPWNSTVVIDTAALDVEAIMRRPHFRFYDPVFGTDPAYWRAVSPTHRLQAAPATPMPNPSSAPTALAATTAEAG